MKIKVEEITDPFDSGYEMVRFKGILINKGGRTLPF